MRDYKNIKAYQRADELTVEIYKVTKQFPKEELYGLVSQIRRAAVSVAANIAEGASRQHKKDYLNFLYISRGSLSELECLLSLSFKLDYIPLIDYQRIDLLRDEVAKTLVGLIGCVEAEIIREPDEVYSVSSSKILV